MPRLRLRKNGRRKWLQAQLHSGSILTIARHLTLTNTVRATGKKKGQIASHEELIQLNKTEAENKRKLVSRLQLLVIDYEDAVLASTAAAISLRTAIVGVRFFHLTKSICLLYDHKSSLTGFVCDG
jgi:hypothetical protein